jgi:hypothetical protein
MIGIIVTDEYVRETGVYDATSTKIIHSVSGQGKQRLSLTISEDITTQVSTTFNIGFSVISAGVGFNVSKKYGVAASSFMDVPAGKWGQIDARAMLKVHNFNVYQEYLGYSGRTKVGEVKYLAVFLSILIILTQFHLSHRHSYLQIILPFFA